MVLNHHPPDLCLLRSWDYRYEHPALFCNWKVKTVEAVLERKNNLWCEQKDK
jgi:hypothetical protein